VGLVAQLDAQERAAFKPGLPAHARAASEANEVEAQ
jgi:hypothetical protein